MQRVLYQGGGRGSETVWGVRLASYGSVTCQRAHWPTHKAACKASASATKYTNPAAASTDGGGAATP